MAGNNLVSDRKYSVASIGPRIDGFLEATLRNAGLQRRLRDPRRAAADDDFETPDVVVKFSGPDVDLLLANRAELLLALEHVTMEVLRMPSEDHSRISFDANDYRLLRIEELRRQRHGRRGKSEAHGRALPLQPHEQPRAPRDPPGPAQRTRRAQREPRIGPGARRGGATRPAWPACPSRPRFAASTSRGAPRPRRRFPSARRPPVAHRALDLRDTIAAIATPPGRGGLGSSASPARRPAPSPKPSCAFPARRRGAPGARAWPS